VYVPKLNSMVGESDPSTIRWIGIHALYTGSLLDAFFP
jgi:hypothetical protein